MKGMPTTMQREKARVDIAWVKATTELRTSQAEILRLPAKEKALTLTQVKAGVLNKFLTEGAKSLNPEERTLIDKELASGKMRLESDTDSGKITFTQGDISTITPTNKTKAIQQLDIVEDTIGLISDYRELLKSSGQVGIVGGTRKVLQGMGEQLEGLAESIMREIDEEGFESDLIGMFDPSLPKLTLLGNELAYSMARSREPGGRLSVDDVNNAKKSLQIEKMLTGKRTIEASLEAFEKILLRKRGIAERRLGKKKPFDMTDDELRKAIGK